jgi:hypothetical protein
MRILCVYSSLIRSHVIRYASFISRVLDAQFEPGPSHARAQSCLLVSSRSAQVFSFLDIELLIHPRRSFP